MANSKAERVRRSSINGTRNKLNVRGKEPGYVYRIVNDIDDRIQSFQEMGYEIVTDNTVTVGDKRISNVSQEGSPVQVSVGQEVVDIIGVEVESETQVLDQVGHTFQLQDIFKLIRIKTDK